MRLLTQKSTATQQITPVKSLAPTQAHFGQSREMRQHAIGNPKSQPLPQNKQTEASSAVGTFSRFAHDFSRVPVHCKPPENVQARLTVSSPGDPYELEADRLAEQVMRMPAPQLERASLGGGESPKRQIAGPQLVREVLAAPGQPIDSATREFMEPRFGRDFGQVRVHTDTRAGEAARSVGARAFTVGNNIVFGHRAFAPRTESGRRLIAHELAHVAQNRPEVLQRTPGVDAEDSWRAMAEGGLVVEPDEPERRSQAQEAVRRFLRVPVAQQMVNGLYNRFRKPDGGCRLRFSAAFVGQLDSAGKTSPGTPVPPSGTQTYQVSVKQGDPRSRSRTQSREWGGGEFVLTERYQDGVSYLASGLNHEVTHVWFINTHRNANYPTGHGIPERGEVDPRFFRQIQSFASQLKELEDTLHMEQQRAEAASEEAQRRPRTPERPATPAPAPAKPVTAPRFGGSASISGGAIFGIPGGPRFAGQFGGSAELILAQIHALKIGPRGIYLTPNHLLLGGALGYRMRSDTGPLFFDIEAGLLQEVTPDSAKRLSRSVTGLMSAGVGGEHGSSGVRFIWEVGGFVLVHDRSQGLGVGASGGPSGSLGVSF